MKYSGNIMIVSEGDIVFERELSADEIIETLLNKSVPPPVADQEEEPEEVSVAARKKRGRPKKSHPATVKARQWNQEGFKPRSDSPNASAGKPCCGSLGKRHRKGCDGEPATLVPPKPKPAPVNVDRMLTEQEYNRCRDNKSLGLTSVEAKDQIGDIDIQHVNYAYMCSTYDAYRRNASKGD